MKKILLISVMTILTIATAKAQEFHLGVKGGINLANLYTEGKNSGAKSSVYIGAIGEYQLFNTLSAELGIQFADNGGCVKKVKTSYYQINVPAAIKFGVAENTLVKAGLYAGYLIAAKKDGESLDLSGDFNRFDYGFFLGVEYVLPTGIFFEGNGIISGSDLGIKDSGSRNRVFQVGVGYRF